MVLDALRDGSGTKYREDCRRNVMGGLRLWRASYEERRFYSYRLDRGAWSPFSTASIANLHHLSPGRHTIQVHAMDRRGNIEPSGDSFEFSVIQPFYRQSAFLMIVGTSCLAILILFGVAVATYRQRGLLIVELEIARR